jgi:hypothetical protein
LAKSLAGGEIGYFSRPAAGRFLVSKRGAVLSDERSTGDFNERFTREKCDALSCIIHYFFMTARTVRQGTKKVKKGDKITTETAEVKVRLSHKQVAGDIKVDEKFFNNFYEGKNHIGLASDSDKWEDVARIFDFFQHWFLGTLNQLRPYVFDRQRHPLWLPRAAEVAFGRRTTDEITGVIDLATERSASDAVQQSRERVLTISLDQAVQAIFGELIDRDRGKLARFLKHHSGVYDAWRFSAHQHHEFVPLGPAGQKNYWVVHSALQIHAPEAHIPHKEPDTYEFPRFTIHHRPQKRPTRPDHENMPMPRSIEGIVMLIKDHVFFVGQDIESGYPLFIVASEDGNDFRGLVIRGNDNTKSIFGSRIRLIKNTRVQHINQLDDEVWIELDVNVMDRIREFKDALLNKALYDGYGGVTL